MRPGGPERGAWGDDAVGVGSAELVAARLKAGEDRGSDVLVATVTSPPRGGAIEEEEEDAEEEETVGAKGPAPTVSSRVGWSPAKEAGATPPSFELVRKAAAVADAAVAAACAVSPPIKAAGRSAGGSMG